MVLSFLLALLQFISTAEGCAPTQPGGTPSMCCPINIYDTASTGMAVFDPALRDCPASALLICSVAVVGNTNPTIILINGATTVVTDPDGATIRTTMTCRRSDMTWLITVNGQETAVSSISCNNA